MSRNPLALGASLFPTPAELDTRSASSSFAGAPLLRLPKKKFFSVQGKLRKFGVIPRTVSTSCKESSARSALGPSLRRGRIEPETFAERDTRQNDAADGLAVRNKRYVTGADIDRAAFTRVYDVAALRVPSDQSEELAYKLKGHLLNWPRIKNIARVTGDQLDEDIEKLWWNGQKKEQAVNDSVRKAVFLEDTLPPAVKTRERITKKELKRRFPHLEALTRPKGTASFLKHKKGKDQGSSYKSNMVEAKGLTRSTWEEKAVVVEIDEAAACTGQSSEQLQGFWGLLEEGKLSRRYRGSTRLLLLDERFAGKPLSEIPMALQVVISAGSKKGLATRELVQTTLKLSYDYWPVDEILKELLPEDVIVQTTFDKLGHIARLHLQEENYSFRHLVAQVVLDRHKPRVRSVVCDVSSTSKSYSRPALELLAGNTRLVTSLVHNGTLFKIDLAQGCWPKVSATGQYSKVM